MIKEGWDATIVAAASASACETLYFEDMNAGDKIHDVTIENPFA